MDMERELELEMTWKGHPALLTWLNEKSRNKYVFGPGWPWARLGREALNYGKDWTKLIFIPFHVLSSPFHSFHVSSHLSFPFHIHFLCVPSPFHVYFLSFFFPFTSISFSMTFHFRSLSFPFLSFPFHSFFFLFPLSFVSISFSSPFPFLCVSISCAVSCYSFPFLAVSFRFLDTAFHSPSFLARSAQGQPGPNMCSFRNYMSISLKPRVSFPFSWSFFHVFSVPFHVRFIHFHVLSISMSILFLFLCLYFLSIPLHFHFHCLSFPFHAISFDFISLSFSAVPFLSIPCDSQLEVPKASRGRTSTSLANLRVN